MITLFITGLEFYGYHGVPPEERAVGHRYIADLELEISCNAQNSDRVEDTVDYASAATSVIETSDTNTFQTVERFAKVAADELLHRFDRIVKVKIRIAKRLPPAPMIVSQLGVELVVHRSN